MNDLNGKVALVTGGARGLGAAICETLFNSKAVVIAVDILAEEMDRMCSQLQASANGHRYAGSQVSSVEKNLRPMVVDLTDKDQIERVFQEIVREYGRLDILVNNAGTDHTISVEELSVESWDRVMAVNLRAPFLTSKFAFPIMRQQGGGAIVNIASTASKRAWANAAAYHASKYGLLGFTYGLHVEGRAANIKVTAIVTGGMRTPFLLDRFPDIDVNNLQDPKNVAEVVKYVLLQPDETVIPEVMVLPMRETSWP